MQEYKDFDKLEELKEIFKEPKEMGINFSQMTADLGSLSYALRNAVEMGFMAREHAGLIWKKWLDLSGLNVPKAKKTKGGDLDNAT